MKSAQKWQPADFSNLEARLVEAKSLLEHAVRLIEAREMETLTNLADDQLRQERDRHEHPIRRRYR
ncbi:MAG: hypothetical protein AAGK37_11000 [Pseudomonadota bacterium]